MADRKEDYVASSFDQAFARARKGGAKTFKWANPKTGKMMEYSTKMAGEETVKSKPAKAAEPARSTLYSPPADTAKFRADRDKPRTGGATVTSPSPSSLGMTKYSTPADTARFRAERDKPRTGGASISIRPDYEGKKEREYMKTGVVQFGQKKIPVPFEPMISSSEEDSEVNMKKGGKVGTVMHEFKTGKLKSSSGQKVSNPKQAIAIAMSEAGMKKPKKFAGKEGSYVGGQSKAPTTKEMTPKDLEAMGRTEVANQEAMRKAREEAKKNAAAPKRYAKGGEVGESKTMMKKEVAFMKRKGAPKSMIKHEEKEAKGMKSGGSAKCYAKGGAVRADGCATKGKTRGKMV